MSVVRLRTLTPRAGEGKQGGDLEGLGVEFDASATSSMRAQASTTDLADRGPARLRLSSPVRLPSLRGLSTP